MCTLLSTENYPLFLWSFRPIQPTFLLLRIDGQFSDGYAAGNEGHAKCMGSTTNIRSSEKLNEALNATANNETNSCLNYQKMEF